MLALRHIAGLLLALALLPLPLFAQEVGDEMVEIKEGEAFNLRTDRAYILFRTPRFSGVPRFEPVFLRIPTEAELEIYDAKKQAAFEEALPNLAEEHQQALERRERDIQRGRDVPPVAPPAPSLETFNYLGGPTANLQSIAFNRAFVQQPEKNTYLVEVTPGDFVLYGTSFATGWSGVHVCYCLGTVGFEASAGEITDLGYFYADTVKFKSDIPELAAESGYGPSSDAGANFLLAGTVRPVREDSFVPSTLDRSRLIAARYHAVGKFVTPNTLGVNRLVPVPGVLDYDRGQVIDVASGQIVPDNYQ